VIPGTPAGGWLRQNQKGESVRGSWGIIPDAVDPANEKFELGA
jgi:hypothetical protein